MPKWKRMANVAGADAFGKFFRLTCSLKSWGDIKAQKINHNKSIIREEYKALDQIQGKANNWRRSNHIAVISFDKGEHTTVHHNQLIKKRIREHYPHQKSNEWQENKGQKGEWKLLRRSFFRSSEYVWYFCLEPKSWGSVNSLWRASCLFWRLW